ncbi:MAG: toxin-antitoxin system YwqK family antitoxin [Fusobacteriaceae bacterium]
MKKIIWSLVFVFFMSCTNSNTIRSEQNLQTYYKEIDNKIFTEINKDSRERYKKILNEEETKNVPLFFKTQVETINENGYKNLYDGFNHALKGSFQLNSKGEVEGVYKVFDDKGNLQEIGYLEKKGVTSGVKRKYYSNGKIAKEIPYYKNKVNGIRKFYYENEKLKEKFYYVDGKEEGIGETYYDNGKIKETAYYKNGEKNGEILMYYPNGNLNVKGTFLNGREEGLFQVYSEDGQKKELIFKKGKLLNINK